MATVKDLSGNIPVVQFDRKLTTVNRANAGDPVGSLTPQYTGEIVFDSTNELVYRGLNTDGSTNASWIVDLLW